MGHERKGLLRTLWHEIKDLLKTLWLEIKEDCLFFGTCGFLVGLLQVLQFRMRAFGIAPKDPWPDSLRSDFMPLSAFLLMYFVLLGMGALPPIFKLFRPECSLLNRVLLHLERRLAQLLSVVISFSAGLAVFSLTYACCTITGTGLRLALLLLALNGVLLLGYFVAVHVARGNSPFDRWWGGMLVLALVSCGVWWIVTRGMS